MAIAYVAYGNLTRHAKDRVNEILVLHPLYSHWTKGAKLGQAGLMAFMHAATWPNCIQTPKCPGYVEDGTDGGLLPTTAAEEWQNIGYSDTLMHKYWHFIRLPIPADASTAEVPRPNIETQLPILIDALNSNAEDPLKSYDLAWVENLIGELHQPLNCTSRYSAAHPNGDENGRAVKVHEAGPGNNLHNYWDTLLGTEDDLASAIKEGKSLAATPNQVGFWEPVDIEKWIAESVEAAKKSVYTPGVVSQDGAADGVVLDAAYQKAAIEVAIRQAALAGNRLASLLNKNLK